MAAPPTSTRRRRRGNHTRPTLDTSVPSPCLSVCRFDGQPFCRGCYRTADEIREWLIMTREQKLTVLEQIAQRRKARGGETLW